jgi:methyl-accepting chemotaxis protein
MIKAIQQSIQLKLVLPIVLGAIVIVSFSTISMFYIKQKNTELTGLITARTVADQVVTLRTFYTNEVVSRAQKAGMRIDFDYASKDNTLPLPTTFVKVLGEEIQKTSPGTLVRLYSHHPFPHRVANEKYDAFEQEAITAVETDPKTTFYRMEEFNGRLSMRYAVADVMRASCVGCHNTHPQSPRTDWKEGDVRGVVEVVVPVDEAAAGLQAGTVRLAGFLGGALALLAVIVVVLLRRTVIKPVQALVAINERVSTGDFAARVPVQSKDEMGELSTGLNTLIDRLVNLLEATQAERDSTQAAIQKLLGEVSDVATGDLTVEADVTMDMTGAIADSFNYMIHQLRTIITQVQETALQVSTSANEIYTTAEELVQGSAAQAEQILESSAALDEMAVSTQHVSENAVLSTTVAAQSLANAKQGAMAVQNTIAAMQRMQNQVQETAVRVKSLGERSKEISEIVQLIGDIADRTSVLALNASIEAALAGEAGQGFAIVAQEVERLAERAAVATRQITGIVNTIQSETHEVVRAMEDSTQEVIQGTQLADQAGQALSEIENVSTRLAELIQAISLASKQQARGSDNLSKAMGEIAEVTQQVATGTKQAAVSINDLASLADALRSSVSAFKLSSNTDRQRNIA